MFIGSKIVGDSQFRSGLLSSGLIATGVALLVFSSAFFLGGGLVSGVGLSSASDELPVEASTMDGPSPASPSAVPSSPTAVPTLADLFGSGPASSASGPALASAEAAPPSPPEQPVLVAPAPPAAPTPTVAPPVVTLVPPSPTPVPTVPPPVPTSPPEPTPTPPPPPAPPQAPVASLVAFEADILAGINAQRVAAGLPVLQLDPNLVMVARERSEDMAKNGYFAHVSPTGDTAFLIMDRYGIPYAWAGENLARNNYPDDESVAVALREWMASQGHRENILNPHYSTVGVGAAEDGAAMKYFTLVFVGF